MSSSADKRVTRIQASQVALLQHIPPGNEAVSSSTDLKEKSERILSDSKAHGSSVSSLLQPTGSTGRVISGSPRPLALQANSHTGSDSKIRNESPWDTYKGYYECDLAGIVTVCVRASDGRAARAIRRFSGTDSDRIMRVYPATSHKNVASIWNCFCTSDALYTLGEFDPLSLDHIVACKAFPDQQQLAAIMSQVCAKSEFVQKVRLTRSSSWQGWPIW